MEGPEDRERHQLCGTYLADDPEWRRLHVQRDLTMQEWRALRAEVKTRDRDAEPDILAPVEAFEDRGPDRDLIDRYFADPARTKANSWCVRMRIALSCCGWPEPPTSAEFYDAVRTTTMTDRQRCIIWMWLQEATWAELCQAWAEQAYTPRQLAAAALRSEPGIIPSARLLNAWALDECPDSR